MNKKWKVLLICVTVLFAFSAVTVYAVTPRYMFDYRWTDLPRVVFWECNFIEDEREEIRSAMLTWNAVADTDGTGLVNFYLSTANNLDSKIERTSTYWINLGYTEPVFDAYNNLIGMEIYLKESIPWSLSAQPGCVDMQSVVLHELGHALCIMHCHDDNENLPNGYSCGIGECPENILSPTIGTNEERRSLTWWDIMQYQYGY